jgi:hypothetical protein
MSAASSLTSELRSEVLRLEDDLRVRVSALPEVESAWRAEYDEARRLERTAAAWEAWVDERVTLASVAWVLTTVFVRFCEDNGLVKPVWITHAGSRSREAVEAQQQFLRQAARSNPDVTDREWLLQAVDYLRGLPATTGLVDETSPMWLVTPSGDAATRLLSFWRERGDDGRLLRDLTDAEWDTRFLGDLYQDISEEAKKRYALLQTPVFVEEFILDRTLEPALNERPLEGFKMIDPTCGSGHFLLGAFARLLDRWHKHAPAMDERERVQAALDAVHGVDINPFAVAIARFRLTVAALRASGMSRLEEAPAFKYHLAAGDSLLHGLDQGELDLGAGMSVDRVAANFAYATENLTELRRILNNDQYDAVVGNPPYIQVKDKALNKLYRQHYSTAVRQYALTVPFMERFFNLAKSGDTAGWVGQITSNSFMKREFGVPLIEEFLPSRDLRLVADTSGAYIPGHGTPTLILVGRNTRPQTETVRAVLGVRGEPGRPDDPSRGLVWSSLVDHIDAPGWSDDWVTISDLERKLLAEHPWSLQGGGAVELSAALKTGYALGRVVTLIGRTCHTGADDCYFAPPGTWRRHGVASPSVVPMMEGEALRDWTGSSEIDALFPYDRELRASLADVAVARLLWRTRAVLAARREPGGTHEEIGLTWFEWSRWHPERFNIPLGVALAFVATHNHFVLDRGGKVFKQSAPVIKLPEGATEEQHLELLGVLNSSTACFWMKQNSYPKGGDPVGDEGARVSQQPWSDRYEFTGTTLQDFPLPAALPLERGRRLDSLAQRLTAESADETVKRGLPTREVLDQSRANHSSLRKQMISEQEELDWEVYRLYDLIEEELTFSGGHVPGLELGERAFEIVLARRMTAGEEETAWFERHGSTPITETPSHWPEDYRRLVERRIELIESDRSVKLLERPEYKRRWASESWEKQEERALRGWLLDGLEDRGFWFDAHGRPTPKSIAQLADEVSRDEDLVSVLALWEGRPDVPVGTSLEKLLAKEGVPYLAAYRYKESGLRKRAAWEHTWELQRREDAGTYNPAPKDRGGDGPIPVPPKYTSADFTRTEYWSNRGKLDVPKERFILYPDAGRETDPTPVLGWAGWDHAEQALALATLIQARESEGWTEEQLVPLVAGLAEVLPWVRQWHAEPEALYGGASPAEFFAEQLDLRAKQVGKTIDELKAWRPAPARRGRRKAST